MSDNNEPNNTEADLLEKEEGGNSVLLLVLILIGGILIGAGGYFGFTLFMGNTTDEAVEEQVEEVQEEEPAPVQEDFSYIDIKRMPAAILDKDGNVTGYVFLDLKLEVPTDSDPAFVQLRLPRIQAAMLKDIAAHGVTMADKPGVIDYDGLNVRFVKVANEAIGGDRIRSVFVFRAIRS